jgi:RimJ/RimL family protein N-acetyltransferase
MIPTLETQRLVLRAPSEADFEADVAFFASDRSANIGGPFPPDLVWRKLAAILGHWVLRGYGLWSVDEKATGSYCGRVGLHYPNGWPEPEIGWRLVADAEGRSIAYEAALAARNHAYETLGWSTAISLIGPGNTRSVALAQRLGATREPDYVHPSYGTLETYRHPSPQALPSPEALP